VSCTLSAGAGWHQKCFLLPNAPFRKLQKIENYKKQGAAVRQES